MKLGERYREGDCSVKLYKDFYLLHEDPLSKDAEPPYENSEHASKVTSDCDKQFPSDTLKLDGRIEKIEQDVVLDAKEGKVFQSIHLSQSCNGSNAYYLSGKSDPINNCKNNSECSAAPCPYATSEISLIAREDLFYMDKTVTNVELPHLSVSTKASPTVKDICIDEGVQMFDKILVEYDKVDQSVFSSSNFPRVNGNGALVEEATQNENLSTNEGLHSLGRLLEIDVGETEFSSPSKCTTYLNDTIDKTAKNDLRYFLVTGYPVEQCHSSSSISERCPLDTTEINACTPSKEIIDLRSHLLAEFNSDFHQVDSSSHNHGTPENQDLRQKLDQVAEEEEDLTTMAAASSAEKAKENKLIAGTVSSNKEEKTSEFVVTSNDAESNRIDNNINRVSDDPEIHGVASTSDLEAKDTSIVGNENKALNNQQSLQSQDVVETEEPVSDGTTSARSSFSHITHGDANLLGPANFSGSITASSHIPHSGNISLRSESSTTSGQSFAFPVLQPEWSSSPVRMAKADRRHLRKHRWKTALTCCKF